MSATNLVGGAGTALLVTCNSQTSAACAGDALISGIDTDGNTGSTSVKFLQGEICDNNTDDNGDGKIDCADPECLGKACPLSGSTASFGQCDATGACTCT